MEVATLKHVGLYLAGAVVGGLVGAMAGSAVAEYIEEKENEKLMMEEEMLIETGQRQVEKFNERAAKAEPKKVFVKPTQPKDYTKSFKETQKDLAMLNTLAAKYTDEVEQVAEEPKTVEGPRVIGLAEFEEDNGYTNMILSYYEEDDTLSDEHEAVVDAPEALIGEEALTSFGKDLDDPDVVYVRDDLHKTDFEIIKMEGSYAEIVLGIKPERKLKKAKPRVRKVASIDNEEENDD